MAAGRLVPDELVIAMVQERIACSEPFPLDGFPRTLALTELLRSHDRSVTAAIFIDAPDHVVIDRIARRDDRRDDDTPERYASGSPFPSLDRPRQSAATSGSASSERSRAPGRPTPCTHPRASSC
jgi:hypothetical protein